MLRLPTLLASALSLALALAFAIGSASAQNNNVTSLYGTWTSGTGAVVTGPVRSLLFCTCRWSCPDRERAAMMTAPPAPWLGIAAPPLNSRTHSAGRAMSQPES
jgi:hypothetical protein